jgi:hypothetical protein
MRYVAERAEQGAARLRYAAATVARVRALGMGDRACVDLACLLGPGEGLLVGSFARCLALVHSECGESRYISSRPFRVNAGPVRGLPAGGWGEREGGRQVGLGAVGGSPSAGLFSVYGGRGGGGAGAGGK